MRMVGRPSEREYAEDDEVYDLDRSRFHPARYESKGETREEILRRQRGRGGGGGVLGSSFTLGPIRTC